MATNDSNQAPGGRQLALQVVHTLRKRITFSDEGTAVIVGRLPAKASVVGGGVHIVTAFDDSSTIDVGFADGSSTDDADAYATALTATAVGFIAFDALSTTTNIQQTEQANVTATVNDGTGASSAGVADVIVMYVVDNDG